MYAVLCDGAGLTVSYDIDPLVHARFGNRDDGLVVSVTDL